MCTDYKQRSTLKLIFSDMAALRTQKRVRECCHEGDTSYSRNMANISFTILLLKGRIHCTVEFICSVQIW